jgi:hypothetical protein
MNQNLAIGVAVVLLLAVGVFFMVGWSPADAPSVPKVENKGPATSTPTTPEPGATKMMPIHIALLDTTGKGAGESRGCDTVNMVTRSAPYAAAVLSASLKALFAEPEGAQPGTAYNFIARTKSTLQFDHVIIENGTANIYLTGSLTGLSGVCDDPRAAIQLEETALQFPTVQKVQLYLNGNPTNLTPSQKGE